MQTEITFPGRVTSISSGSQFTDRKQRATIEVAGADQMWTTIRIPNELELSIDQAISVKITAGPKATDELQPTL